MVRSRVIVGVGEAFLAETSDREVPAGLALLVPMHAVLLGHTGIAVSRLGQDSSAELLLSALRDHGVDVGHLQSDPDLATARARLSDNGAIDRLDPHAAFDNLQWDFDLQDVAQRADAVVFGALSRRSGQARSTTDRFLDACSRAVRVFDTTGCTGDDQNRARVLSGLRHAGVVVVDDDSLRLIQSGAAEGSPREAANDLLHQGLDVVLIAQEGRPLAVQTTSTFLETELAHQRRTHGASLAGFLHGTLAGWDVKASMQLAERLARHELEHPNQPPPPEWLG